MIAGSARAEAAAANSTNSDILPIDSGKFLLQGIDLSFYVKATDLSTGMHYTTELLTCNNKPLHSSMCCLIIFLYIVMACT
jgi:hypothetical protein